MIDFSIWSYLDTIILIFQIFLCVLFYTKNRVNFGTINTLGLVLSAYLFITPLGLFPVAIAWTQYQDSLIRNLFWHAKLISNISINDIIILIYFLILVLYSLKYFKKKIFFVISILLFAIYTLGILSSINAPLGVDVKLLFNSSRSFIIVFLGLFLGYRLSLQIDDKWRLNYIVFLVYINSLSMLSMILLEHDAKGIRYWTTAIIQSQGAANVSIILLVYLMYSNAFFRENIKRKLLYLFPVIIAIGGAVKFLIFAFLLLLIGKVLLVLPFFNTIFKKLIYSKFFIIFITISLPTIIVIVNSLTYGIGAVDTRYFQILNGMLTIYDGGVSSILFGIGWKQWYIEFFSFPFIDYGAWTAEEIARDDAKNAIQIIPFSFIRSVGLIGILILFVILRIVIISSRKFAFNSKDKIKYFYLFMFLSTELFAIPDVLPEVALFYSTIIFSLLTNNNKQKVEN